MSIAAKKKAAARARRMPRYTSGPKKGKFKPRGARKNPAKRRAKGRLAKTGRSIRLKATPRSRKKTTYRPRRTLRRSTKSKRYYRYGLVRKNPIKAMGAALKSVLPMYGGFLATRVLNVTLKHFVTDRFADKLPEATRLVIPSAVTFLVAAGLLPKTKLLKGNMLKGVQMGATLAFLDSIVKQVATFIPPQAGLAGKIVTGLAGYDDMGVQGYGLSAYVADPSGYSLPAAQPGGAIGGYGAEVQEAMALNEYVSEPYGGYGAQVEEALADSEMQYMQDGGAGGSLRRTIFTS
jgi:hypothetical protein